MRILIIDDDKNISNILDIALKDEGYDVTTLNDSRQAKEMIVNGKFDLMLLDIMMPHVNGFDICKHARYFTDMPILFITCLDNEQSLVTALELGGDDYIRKPFNLTEVVMRVKTHLRRVARNKVSSNPIYEISGYIYYYGKKLVVNGDKRIHLSPIENDLLKLFLENEGKELTYKDIYEIIWNEPYVRNKATIMTRVSQLRNKLPYLDIESIRGKGYKYLSDNKKI